jgi:hypothetical protein
VAVGEDVVHCVDFNVVVEVEGSIGEGHVAVQITLTVDADSIPPSWYFFLRLWDINQLAFNGFILQDHLKRD